MRRGNQEEERHVKGKEKGQGKQKHGIWEDELHMGAWGAQMEAS